MKHDIVDADARAQALDVTRSWIVQAPAGSGKTELLTQRYLALLARVSQPEDVLAITFTRKAAAEMRRRILNALDCARSQPCPALAHQRQTWELAKKVLVQDDRCEWALRDSPSRLRIQTIDSLCASLVRQMPVTAGLGAVPATTTEPDPLYREAARATLVRLESGHNGCASVRCLLGHLDNNVMRTETMVALMLAKRDQWLRHVADPGDFRIGRESLEAVLRSLVKETLLQARSLLVQSPFVDLLESVQYAARNCQKADQDSPIRHCLGLRDWPEAAYEALPQWQGLATLLLTDKDQWRATVSVQVGFPAKTAGKDAAQKQEFDLRKQAFLELLSELRGNESMRLALASIRRVPAPCYQDDQWQVLEALFEVLRIAVAELKLIFQAQGQADFSEVMMASVVALGHPDNPSDLALQLDHRIQHLLVDEFQDTSITQFGLFEKLVAGWQSDDGRTLFVVGDPMQSIYRFREAEVGLFLRARRHGIGDVPLHPLQLSVNFRAVSGLVDWFNQTFKQVFPSTDNITTGAIRYAMADALGQDQADIQIHPFIGADGDQEPARVLAIIDRIRHIEPTASIAILVRSRTHLVPITTAMDAHGVEWHGVDIERLAQRSVVRDLRSLLHALLNLDDRLSWLSILRAPWCGIGLADLLAITTKAGNGVLWNVLGHGVTCEGLSPHARAALARCSQVFKKGLEQQGRGALSLWLEEVWRLLGGPACVTEASDLEDADAFFCLLRECDQDGWLLDLEVLDERLVKLYASARTESEGAVQVMTIHKSKGLEFDYVILPGLARRARGSDSRLLLWEERTQMGGVTDLAVAPVKAAEQDDSPIYRWLQQIESARGMNETSRLLYVAATRARKGVHLLACLGLKASSQPPRLLAPVKGTLLEPLWPIAEPEFTQALAQKIARSDTGQAAAIEESKAGLQRLPADWQLPAPPTSISLPSIVSSGRARLPIEPVEFSWAGDVARHVGTAVHRYLQHFSQSGVDGYDAERIRGQVQDWLAASGVPDEQLAPAVDQVDEALRKTLGDTRAAWILDNLHESSASELSLTGMVDGQLAHVVIDRTFVDAGGIRWIIDYKSGKHSGSELDIHLDREQQRYRPQLERYARLMSKMESRPIRLALYFPAMAGWREWSYSSDNEDRENV
ncbi:MAG TPA: DNA helicase UvrD [Chromatiales bacterium]|nr:DNA helicase UvrD [Chromatiales bacterium]HIO13828.1 DNA helicase UvrD [Chromatiales bacterium]